MSVAVSITTGSASASCLCHGPSWLPLRAGPPAAAATVRAGCLSVPVRAGCLSVPVRAGCLSVPVLQRPLPWSELAASPCRSSSGRCHGPSWLPLRAGPPAAAAPVRAGCLSVPVLQRPLPRSELAASPCRSSSGRCLSVPVLQRPLPRSELAASPCRSELAASPCRSSSGRCLGGLFPLNRFNVNKLRGLKHKHAAIPEMKGGCFKGKREQR